MQHKTQIDTRIATGFLTRSFHPDETIAIVLRRVSPPTIAQRIVTLERALQPRYLAWLAHENASRSERLCGRQSTGFPAAGSGPRKASPRSDICISISIPMETRNLTALRARMRFRFRPQSSSTSAGKYQVLWRVESIPFEQQESLLKVLAITFGGDPACTDLNRVLRLPGFLNQKYAPAPVVTVEYPSDSTWHSQDFQLADPEPNRELIRPLIGSANAPGKHSHSESGLGVDPRGISARKGPRKADPNAG